MSSSSNSKPSNVDSSGGRGGRGGRNGRGSGRGRGGRRHSQNRKRHHNNNNNNNNTADAEAGRLRRISKSLSWALRHGAVELGLTMTPDGFCPVDEIINHAKYKSMKMTRDEIRKVVETNDKQRYKLQERPTKDYIKNKDDKKVERGESEEAAASAQDTSDETETPMILVIRANQGHSLPVANMIDPNLLLSPLSSEELTKIPTIVHGTYRDKWQQIQKSGGLKRMSRHHIHFAAGMPGHDGVISGMRKSCQVYIHVNAQKCANDNIVFYQSDNGVLLTAGNEDGLLPVAYFSHVVDDKGNILLDQREAAS